MSAAETLEKRVRESLRGRRDITEKRMFGGLCFLHRGNMLCGIDNRGQFMLRVGRDEYEYALQRKHVKEMDFTGKPLRGMIYVKPEGVATQAQIARWVSLGMRFTRTLPRR